MLLHSLRSLLSMYNHGHPSVRSFIMHFDLSVQAVVIGVISVLFTSAYATSSSSSNVTMVRCVSHNSSDARIRSSLSLKAEDCMSNCTGYSIFSVKANTDCLCSDTPYSGSLFEQCGGYECMRA